MTEEANNQKKRFDLSNYGVVVGFLSLEVIAFISFYLGHSFLFYGILSLVLAILLVLVTFRQIKKDGLSSFAFFLFPLFVFGLLTALSKFNSNSIGHISLGDTIFVPIALACMALGGYLSAHIEKFKIRYALLVIYGALGLFVLINLIITMIYYVPFYTLIYKNSYIVYNGRASVLPIGSMAYMLFGFSIKEVSIEYWSLFPSILFTAIIPLFFIKFKENKRDFLIFAGLAFLAFLSLLFTISKITLLTDAVLIIGITVIILVAKLHKSRSILDGLFIGVGVLALIFFIVLFLIAQQSWSFLNGFRGLFSKSALISRIFVSNRYSSSVIVIFQDLFTSFKLFGWQVGYYGYQYPNGVAQELSNIWLFDNLISSGLFGAIFFIAALFFGIRRLFKYVKLSEEENADKYLIVGYVLGSLAVSLLLLDATPLVNSDMISPFFTCSPLLIVLFLLGYTFHKSTVDQVEEKVEEVKTQEVKQDEEVISL